MSYNDKSVRAKVSGKRMSSPRTHSACTDVYGVARPGKTAVDKSRGHVAGRKNRRIWDSKEQVWKKT